MIISIITAYGLVNAVGEYIDHERTVLAMNGRTREDARMQSIMFGSGAQLKQDAFGLMTRVKDLAAPGSSGGRVEQLVEAMVGRN